MAIQILSPAHEAAFDEQNGLLIKALDDEDASVALTREEVAVLRALITPPVTNKQLTELLIKLDAIAQDRHKGIWGLPLFQKKSMLAMREVIRDWLAALNQPPAPSLDCEGAKEQQRWDGIQQHKQ